VGRPAGRRRIPAVWGTYLLAACLWFIHGLARRDKAIYVACIGWILLNGAVVLGLLVQR